MSQLDSACQLEVGTAWIGQNTFRNSFVPPRAYENSGLGVELGQEGFVHFSNLPVMSALMWIRIRAVIVEDQHLAAQYLAALLDDTQRLAEYKVPETLEIVHEILRNTFGKIDRSSVIDNGFGM